LPNNKIRQNTPPCFAPCRISMQKKKSQSGASPRDAWARRPPLSRSEGPDAGQSVTRRGPQGGRCRGRLVTGLIGGQVIFARRKLQKARAGVGPPPPPEPTRSRLWCGRSVGLGLFCGSIVPYTIRCTIQRPWPCISKAEGGCPCYPPESAPRWFCALTGPLRLCRGGATPV